MRFGRGSALLTLAAISCGGSSSPAPATPGTPCDGVTLEKCVDDARVALEAPAPGAEDKRDPAVLARAIARLTHACDAGHRRGCSVLGSAYRLGIGVDQSLPRAIELYTAACDGGDAQGCDDLGVSYEMGNGVTRDLVRANELYQKACDGGSMTGCTNRGFSHALGAGGPRDPARAAVLYRKACDGGDQRGCTKLGVATFGGDGVEASTPEAIALVKSACDASYIEACVVLGVFHQQIPEILDVGKSHLLFDAACKAGDPTGCFNQAVLFAKGLGTEQNLAKARELFGRACDGGLDQACVVKRQLESR